MLFRSKSFVEDPLHSIIGCSQPSLAGLADGADAAECVLFDSGILPPDGSTMDWLADYLLTAGEREIWQMGERTDDRRKREWLAGRIAAKDAVRLLMERHNGVVLGPRDIEIARSAEGRPFVRGLEKWLADGSLFVPVSISHTQGMAVALAVLTRSDTTVGIDAEKIERREAGFEEMVFSAEELADLHGFKGLERDVEVTRLWCAREAAAKVLGSGLSGALRGLRVERCKRASEHLAVSPVGYAVGVAQTSNWSPCQQVFSVKTLVSDGVVFAVSIRGDWSVKGDGAGGNSAASTAPSAGA